jgi:hypothetical protein
MYRIVAQYAVIELVMIRRLRRVHVFVPTISGATEDSTTASIKFRVKVVVDSTKASSARLEWQRQRNGQCEV